MINNIHIKKQNIVLEYMSLLVNIEMLIINLYNYYLFFLNNTPDNEITWNIPPDKIIYIHIDNHYLIHT